MTTSNVSASNMAAPNVAVVDAKHAVTPVAVTNIGTANANANANVAMMGAVPLTLDDLKAAAVQLGVRVVVPKKMGRPRKYSTEEESKRVKRQRTKEYLEQNGYDKIREHMASNSYAAQLAYHQRTGYAAQKAWRERQREKKLAERLALLQQDTAPAQAPRSSIPTVPATAVRSTTAVPTPPTTSS